MMLYKNMKTMFRYFNGDIDDSISSLEFCKEKPNSFIIFKDYVLRTSIDLTKNNFTLKEKSKNQTISSRNYNRRRLRRWSSTSCKYTYQAESLLHSLEQVSDGIGLHANENKTEFIYFKRERAISTLSHKKSSHTSAPISHQQKMMSPYA